LLNDTIILLFVDNVNIQIDGVLYLRVVEPFRVEHDYCYLLVTITVTLYVG